MPNKTRQPYYFGPATPSRWRRPLFVISAVSAIVIGGIWLLQARSILPFGSPALSDTGSPVATVISSAGSTSTAVSATSQPADDNNDEVLCPTNCDALRQQMLELVNRDRSANQQPPLSLYHPANIAAQGHAEDMLRRNYFDHLSPEGENPGMRLARANAGPAGFWAENIWMYESGKSNGVMQPVTNWPDMVAQAEENWMNSPGHRANLLNGNPVYLGVGIAYDASHGGIRMVQNFFAPQQ